MQSLLSWSKRNRSLLVWAAVLTPALWWFNYSAVIPLCTRYSKPITKYLEWNESQIARGTPARMTFRIPFAYMLPNPIIADRASGKAEFINFSIDTRNGTPGCLLWRGEIYEQKANAIHNTNVSLRPGISNATGILEHCTRYPKLVSNLAGFSSHKSSSLSKCYVPTKNDGTPIIFRCIITNAPPVLGCTGITKYRDLTVHYSLRDSQLPDWQRIQAEVFKKIDSFIVTIEE